MTNIIKINDHCWEIPRTGNMQVPGRIYTSKKMLAVIKKEETFKQVANVATLPGIVKASLAMPDIHWGYGFPIGGVAATDWDKGVISPGGVGYDINCLCSTARILHQFGYTQTIGEMESNWHASDIKCQNLQKGHDDITPIVHYIRMPPQRMVYRLMTTGGDEILATEDHPFWTPNGMVELGQLKDGDRIARYPFEGVPHETPACETLVDENDIRRILADQDKGMRGNTLSQIINQLKKRNLLPLQTDSPLLPYLIKLMGFVFGDGTLYFENGSGKGITWFYGEESDLEQIRSDVEKSGFTPSRIYRRNRDHTINTTYGRYQFQREELSFKVVGSAFASLLTALGTPVGQKASQDYRVPGWLFRAPRWHQRLFLASFFGAELSSPRPFKERNYNFNPPILSLNKRGQHIQAGRLFLEDIAELLKGFGVEAKKISQRTEQTNADGSISYRLLLILSSESDSLINLWAQVGFEYNRKRMNLAMAAVEYLKQKKNLVAIREETAARAAALYAAGMAPQKIYQELASKYVNQRFLQRSVYEGRATSPRIGSIFETFDQFCSHATVDTENTGMVWSTVKSIEKVDLSKEKDFDGYVYDFTVAHPDHNFIANGFVVSNCGVRLARTNLTESEVRPQLADLVNSLFQNVPSGVGSTGPVKLTVSEEKRMLREGSRWAVNQGFGEDGDLTRTEENGCMADADPDEVSDRALERGKKQLGTLGSGNHFLEVGIVDEVFEPDTANAFGLFEDQVVLLVHSGSRGFGYQVCDDFLAVMSKEVKKLPYELPDRQLACAMIQSEAGQRYLRAMACAANYAWNNRQILMHRAKEVFLRSLQMGPRDLGMGLVYDVCHNIAKKETHVIDGKNQDVCVHRKGATRSFPKGHPALGDAYRHVGQPVLVPGDMGTASYVLVGTDKAMEETFGSTCHGAGRVLSRKAAKKASRGRAIHRELEDRGILVRASGRGTMAEEMPDAYKDISQVVDVVHNAGISRKVARLRPIAVVKG